MSIPLALRQPNFRSLTRSWRNDSRGLVLRHHEANYHKMGKQMVQNMTDDYVVRRIEHAGATLRCLRIKSPSTLLARGRIEILQEVGVDMTPDRVRLAYPVPSARDVSLMDESLSWIWLIPNRVKRRVVSLRSQFHPYQEKNIISWRRCGEIIGADHKTARVWHAQAINLIVLGLRGTEIKSPSGCNIVPDHVQLHWLDD